PPAKGARDQEVDAHLSCRVQVSGGPHQLGVTFPKKSSSLLETTRQPLNVHFNYYRHPRLGPAVYEVSIDGPFQAGAPGDTPSRQAIFTCRPTGEADEVDCARRILARLARRAFRRPVQDDELDRLIDFYQQGRATGDFESGIEMALAALLVNPQFLFRIERDPPQVASGDSYEVSPWELASRLSFFLWSSLPDEQLLAAAERGQLREPAELERQVRRMLADERSQSLVTNFAAQWLYLRNLEAVTPDMRLFPDFDDNLRQAMRRETELLVAGVLRDDRSVLQLLATNQAWLNERLARHYGIPHVHGSRFRRVELDEGSHRGGLLRQGSILTVTSYATRTSPVIRGHWVLQNLVGSPPPPPPPDVPALADNTVSSKLPIRERLAQHAKNEACAVCHRQMDPVGFALENYDAVGRWREFDDGIPIDAAGGMADGGKFTGIAGLERALLAQPEWFVGTLTERLLAFGLGRGVEHFDAPAVRQIVRDAKAEDYRLSSLVLGIARSVPFQMRKAP
ncbi:MAG: DUF1592 domain-containing protein, partial [Pirellulaceae bacterium]|nr:DUF1592 domain-containing protein [Pirellulaceae bacterium]